MKIYLPTATISSQYEPLEKQSKENTFEKDGKTYSYLGKYSIRVSFAERFKLFFKALKDIFVTRSLKNPEVIANLKGRRVDEIYVLVEKSTPAKVEKAKAEVLAEPAKVETAPPPPPKRIEITPVDYVRCAWLTSLERMSTKEIIEHLNLGALKHDRNTILLMHQIFDKLQGSEIVSLGHILSEFMKYVEDARTLDTKEMAYVGNALSFYLLTSIAEEKFWVAQVKALEAASDADSYQTTVQPHKEKMVKELVDLTKEGFEHGAVGHNLPMRLVTGSLQGSSHAITLNLHIKRQGVELSILDTGGENWYPTQELEFIPKITFPLIKKEDLQKPGFWEDIVVAISIPYDEGKSGRVDIKPRLLKLEHVLGKPTPQVIKLEIKKFKLAMDLLTFKHPQRLGKKEKVREYTNLFDRDSPLQTKGSCQWQSLSENLFPHNPLGEKLRLQFSQFLSHKLKSLQWGIEFPNGQIVEMSQGVRSALEKDIRQRKADLKKEPIVPYLKT